MHRADTFLNPGEPSRPPDPEETPMDYYRGVELAPTTLESLVTWDVSGHARCEQERLSSAYRNARVTRGGY
jgi:hypothetical protein